MDLSLYPMIFKRKSFHLFRDLGEEKLTEEDLEDIRNAWHSFAPLFPEIRTAVRIVKAEETNCRRGEEYCILLYSEEKENHLANIGYLGEQLDLYLASMNIASLWFGIGKTEEKSFGGLSFVIMIAIARTAETRFRKDMFRSKRKEIPEIWEGERIEGVTDIVRFAPSACNTQPWFVKNGKELEVFRCRRPGKRGIMPADRVVFYNRIDIGIFLCILELCLLKEGIRFERELIPDPGGEEEFTRNAVYRM